MGEGTFAARLDKAEAEFGNDPVIGKIVAFIRDGGKRPLMMPETGSDTVGSDPAS